MNKRIAVITRTTKETDINAELCLDGGDRDIKTGVGFFDHMLDAFVCHGGFGLKLYCKGDLEVDAHHTVEDCGIVLGKAIDQALGDRAGITRFGSSRVPMDEALACCDLDLSRRAFLHYDSAGMENMYFPGFDSRLPEEFFRALAFNSGTTLHLSIKYGTNPHHMTEAAFKACARALRQAVVVGGGTNSTKGVL